tara:strand:- start:192 stop:1265 length:1074 start_codon:yes stop_codon:yes gene_type:complete
MIVLDRKKIYNYLEKAQLLLGFLFFYTSCEQENGELSINGETMGTTYSIKIIDYSDNINKGLLKNQIDSVLNNINTQMSTWDPNSEISKFNRWLSTQPYPLSKPLLTVIDSALSISKKTDGLFDISIYELMSLWGFGPNPKKGMPSFVSINNALSHSGYNKIMINRINNTIIKQHPMVKLDLNALAKGYGVDIIFKFIKEMGVENLFIEIGGEVRTSGKNKTKNLWSIGIENPLGGQKKDIDFAAIVHLENEAIATSGNYRNIVNIDGEAIGHTINPKTGFPIQTNVLSVTVFSRMSMISDAWATALMVMDYKTGLDYVNRFNDIEAIWIIEEDNGTRMIGCSDGAKMIDNIYEIKS